MHTERTGRAGTELDFSPGYPSDSSAVRNQLFDIKQPQFSHRQNGLAKSILYKHCKNKTQVASKILVQRKSTEATAGRLAAVHGTFSLSKDLNMISVSLKTHETPSTQPVHLFPARSTLA